MGEVIRTVGEAVTYILAHATPRELDEAIDNLLAERNEDPPYHAGNATDEMAEYEKRISRRW